jgi:hypothetical protein
MATNLVDLRSNLRTELMTDPNGKIWTNSTLDNYLDQAYQQVQIDGNYRWPDCAGGDGTVSLVSGTREYSLTAAGITDLGTVEIIFLGTSELASTNFKSAIRRNTTNSTGKPSDYYLRGDSIGLDPIPNGGDPTVTVYYRRRLATPTDTVNMGLSDDFIGPIVKYAAYLAWSSPRGNKSTALEKVQDYQLAIDRLFGMEFLRDENQFTYNSYRESYNTNYPKRLS